MSVTTAAPRGATTVRAFTINIPEAEVDDLRARIVATRSRCTPGQVALAWALTFPNVLHIPGTSSIRHLCQNLAASGVQLDSKALQQLSRIGDEGSGR